MNSLLFVDDEVRVLDGLKRMLRSKRDVWDCHFATSVDEAWAVIEERELDAVVSDLNMPGKNGLELLWMLRQDERTHFTPFLMLTGNGDVSMKRAALEGGATDFLSKPFDFIELQARLQNVIALKTFQDEIRRQNTLLEERVIERTQALEQSRRDIIFRLAKAAETRDTDTGNHIIRVGLLSQMLAAALGIDESGQQSILMTSPLHDVGKIGISDQILRKPGPLTHEERKAMQEHCRLGAEILTENLDSMFRILGAICGVESDDNQLLNVAASIAMYHHEWWDGTGYPEGRKGIEIPLEARIVAVADVYDALRSERPYKRAFSAAEALEIITKASGTQFDPAVVAALRSNSAKIEEALATLRKEPDVFRAAA